MTKYPRETRLQEERLISAHGFRGYCPRSAHPSVFRTVATARQITWQRKLLSSRRPGWGERGGRSWSQQLPQGHSTQWPLSLTRSHILRLSSLSLSPWETIWPKPQHHFTLSLMEHKGSNRVPPLSTVVLVAAKMVGIRSHFLVVLTCIPWWLVLMSAALAKGLRALSWRAVREEWRWTLVLCDKLILPVDLWY